MADSEARLFDADGNNIGTYRLEVMDTFWKRFMGLMGRDDVPIGIAALFRKCSSIHMFFMKVPLDVIYYGAAMPDGRVPVLSVARDVKPWQLSFGPKRTRGCLEVAAGTVPKNLDAIEIVAATSSRSEPSVTPPDYRDVVRDRIQVTRCDDSAAHLGGAAALLHGRNF
ncbi:putative ACR [Collinsella aerofaciens]|nr:putative ACR [Collinsella aerofaciens]